MSRSFFVTFRGQEDVEVVIDRDYGDDPDTGSWEVDWHFADDSFKDLELTQAELDALYERIYNYLRNDYVDDIDPIDMEIFL
jgi:hypothetical protein